MSDMDCRQVGDEPQFVVRASKLADAMNNPMLPLIGDRYGSDGAIISSRRFTPSGKGIWFVDIDFDLPMIGEGI